jgi:hypothetical protein
MGWYYTGSASRADLIRELTAPQQSESTGWERRALRFCTAGNVLWTVWEITAPGDGSTHLHIGCDLLHRSSDGWGHKPMCEDDEPCYYTCPLAYLEMVPDSKGRPEWRAKVRAYWKKRRERAAQRRERKARMMGAAHA